MLYKGKSKVNIYIYIYISKISKQLAKILAFVLSGILLGTIALTGVYAVSEKYIERIEAHVYDSVDTLMDEGLYPDLGFSGSNTALDGFTDSWMVLISAYSDPEKSPLEKAAMSYYASNSDIPWYSLSLYNKERAYYMSQVSGMDLLDQPIKIQNYARYWHGYQCFLRPALMFMDYGEIRIVNCYLQTALALAALFLVKRRAGWPYMWAYAALLLVQCPYTTSMSLQYSSVYYTYLIFSIAILLWYEKIKKNGWQAYVFCLAGMTTSFLDLLTYPMVTFAVPLILLLILEPRSFRDDLKICIRMGAAWVFGYGGMWAGKWMLATLATGENVFANAVNSMQMRTQGTINGYDTSIMYSWNRNLDNAVDHPVFFAVLLLSAAVIVYRLCRYFAKCIKRHREKSRSGIVDTAYEELRCCSAKGEHHVLLLVALLPLLWTAVLQNHSIIHSWFVWREFLITVFALACWIAGYPGFYKVKEVLKRKDC